MSLSALQIYYEGNQNSTKGHHKIKSALKKRCLRAVSKKTVVTPYSHHISENNFI